MIEFLLIVGTVLGLLGALARLTVGYDVHSNDRIDGDRVARPTPMWFTRPTPLR